MAIDPTTYRPQKSRWQDLFVFLQKKGYDVRSPGTDVGECTSKYIVIRNAGQNNLSGFSTDDDTYQLELFVPQQKYSELEPFVQKLKKDMKELYPMMIFSGMISSSIYDDSLKAHYVSITYTNHKKSF